MKHTFALTSLIFASILPARADVMVEQKMESAFMNGNMVMKIKGDNARMDMPGGPAGKISVLMNLKDGQMTTLMHSQKMAMKMKMDDIQKQSEAAQKASGIDASKIEKPKPTGQKEKVAEWDAEIYEIETGAGVAKLWVAKDFPNFKVISSQINSITSKTAGNGFDPSKFDLPGMVVKSEMTTPVGKVTTTLTKVSEDNIQDSEFAMPEGYKEMAMPGGQK